ncbi:ArgE/DapE family deacylase [Apilactobacillus sp. F1]|nr:ArgE/DapE family deacylase [Apilactobacillus sp. F1]
MEKEEQLQVLKDLVAFNTVDANERDIADYLSQLFKKHGIASEIVDQFDNRSNLVAHIGSSSKKVLAFAGHEDTVHENNLADWTHDPFIPYVEDGKIYGRGVTDMKSGLAAQVIALIELKEEHVDLSGQLRFLATISEELTQGGANFLSKRGDVDDVDAIVIGEPTGQRQGNQNHHYIVYAHKGALIYTVKSVGKAAHSSTPELGIDAIDNLINYRQEEKQYFAKQTGEDDILGKTIYTPDIFEGGKQVNSIPDFAYQKVMVRTIPQLNNDQIIADLQELVDSFNQKNGYNLELEVNFSGYPVKNDADSSIVNAAQAASEEILGNKLDLKTLSMGTDASQFKERNQDVDVIILGPGNDTAHQTDEYVDLESFYSFIRLYKQIAINYLK